MYMDEAVFYVSGTKSKTWALRGKGTTVLSKASRKSKKVFGAITVEDNPHFHFRFAEVFNGKTFLKFLKGIERQWKKKIHIIMDNAKYHFSPIVKEWVSKKKKKVTLHPLPSHSPEFNAQEGVWRITRRKMTHNKFFESEENLHSALFRQFNRFQGNPPYLRGVIEPFR